MLDTLLDRNRWADLDEGGAAVVADQLVEKGLLPERMQVARIEHVQAGDIAHAMIVIRAPALGDDPMRELVLVPGGTFTMGGERHEPGWHPREGPRRSVTVSPFLIARYQTTIPLWHRLSRRISAPGEPDLSPHQLRLPTIGQSWFEVAAWIGEAGLALPTEAQWEYACRAGTEGPYWTGEALTAFEAQTSGPGMSVAEERPLAATTETVGEFREPAPGPMPVGRYPCNGFGLFDMHGNVWEWCRDWFGPYPARDESDPIGPSDGMRRVVRGGSFNDPASAARSGARNSAVPTFESEWVGFRVACDLPTLTAAART